MAKLRLPFKINARRTQTFGNKFYLNGVDVYGQWKLKGHNGIDYGLPNDTPLYAPHSGRIIESLYDKGGYGHYVKIENGEEGSVLAHMRKSVVKKGDTVKQGQLVGYSNNSGYSTGPHLHWGYYRKPRDRSNGYAGYIDQQSYLDDTDTIENFLISVGYTYTTTHLGVVKELHKSDLKLKSGEYISKKDYNTAVNNLNDKNKDAIKNALENAKKKWKVDSLAKKVKECEKVSQTTAYKIAVIFEKFTKTVSFEKLIKMLKIGDKKNG